MRRLLPVALIATSLGAQDTTVARDTALLVPAVVTVTRLPLEASRAPYAIAIVGRDEIQRGKAGLALDEALGGIPGVQVDNRFNYALGERISIRGMGARAQFGVRGIRVVLDDIPMTLADGQTTLNNVDVASVARAEVIRGPASALHGNAAGGVIQLTTNDPFDLANGPVGGEVRTEVGAHGLRRFQATVGARSTEVANALTVSRLQFDGFRQWNAARNDHVTFRRVRNDDTRSFSVALDGVDYDGQNPGGMSTAMLAANRDSAFERNTQFRTGEEGRQLQGGASWRYRLGAASEFSFTAHGAWRDIDNPIPNRIVAISRLAGGTRLQLSTRTAVGGVPMRVAGGTELQLQRDDRRNYINEDGVRGADTLDQLERVRNAALFAQAEVALAPQWLLLAGARYDRIRFAAEDRLVSAGNPDDSGERTMQAVSPSVGVTWSPAPRVDVYGNVSTSFETPTTSELANQESGAGGFNPALEPQRTTSMEVGANGRILVGGIAGSWQLAAFRSRVTDALIPFEVASVPGRQYFRNAGSTTQDGAEAATRLVLPAGLSLRMAYTRIDARFERYATATDTFDGKRVPGVAPSRGDVLLSWQRGNAFIDAETRLVSAIPVNDANDAESPAYATHGLRIGLRDVAVGAARFSPHVGIINLGDAEYNTSVVVNAFGGRFFEPGPPRSLYAGVSATF